MSSFGDHEGGSSTSEKAGSSGSGGGPSRDPVELDDEGMTTTGGQEITSDSVTTDLGGGRTQTLYKDGRQVITEADGSSTTTQSSASFELSSKPSGETDAGLGTTDEDSEDTEAAEDPTGTGDTEDAALTTGDESESATRVLALPPKAGPEAGPGIPGDQEQGFKTTGVLVRHQRGGVIDPNPEDNSASDTASGFSSRGNGGPDYGPGIPGNTNAVDTSSPPRGVGRGPLAGGNNPIAAGESPNP
jgi:hypothetical protein